MVPVGRAAELKEVDFLLIVYNHEYQQCSGLWHPPEKPVAES